MFGLRLRRNEATCTWAGGQPGGYLGLVLIWTSAADLDFPPIPHNAARGFASSIRNFPVSSSIRLPTGFWKESDVRLRELSGLSHPLSVLVHNGVMDHSTGEEA